MAITPEQLEILSGISTEVLANYLQRRREAENLTDSELRERAAENWSEAENDADDLKNKGKD